MSFRLALSNSTVPQFVTTLAALAALFVPSQASAGLESCGNINVQAEAQCEAVIEDCDLRCEPLAFRAACAGKLYVECGHAMCDADIQVDCTPDCEGECRVDCDEFDEGSLDCQGHCAGKCETDCSAKCKAHADANCEGDGCEAEAQAECEASCASTCSGECEASCEATPPSADCDAKCEASCSGQCKAEANIDCQIECQVDRMGECQVEYQGGCEGDCSDPKGAIFCDGQYVDHGDNFQDCIDALNDVLTVSVQVSGSADADAECTDDGCTAKEDAKGSVSCASLPHPASSEAWGWWLAALGFASFRRRSQPKRSA
jgi:MYXO-CTERM domain-containing protein